MQYGYQNLMLILNPLKNGYKTNTKKLSAKKLQKNGIFGFSCCVRTFSTYKFFRCTFLHSFQRILYLMIPLSNFCKINTFLLLWALFASLKPKCDEMTQNRFPLQRGFSEWRRMNVLWLNECMYVIKNQKKINKKSGILPPNLRFPLQDSYYCSLAGKPGEHVAK